MSKNEREEPKAATTKGPATDDTASEELADLAESPGETLASARSLERTSDALYILREGSYLLELDEALEEKGIELKEVE